MKIVFIGSGNLATHLSLALQNAGHDILQIYSRTLSHAQVLASTLNDASAAVHGCATSASPLSASSAATFGCVATDSISSLRTDADAYIFSIKDDALPSTISAVYRRVSCNSLQDNHSPLFIHTAGSVPLYIFEDTMSESAPSLRGRAGGEAAVLYPMQTFSKSRSVNFRDIPCFIEGSSAQALQEVKKLATSISTHVVECSSEKRRKLHLAAVFACNLVNHCYRLAERTLEADDLDFSLFQPLIMETAKKVGEMSPRNAQTGPMVRYDQTIMNAQLSLIPDERTREIYRLMAASIHEDALTTSISSTDQK